MTDTIRTAAITDLTSASATGLAALVRSGRASALEVVEAHLARIGAVNPRLNAVTEVLGDEALAAARRADQRRARGEAAGPLDGVPFTVKENIDVAGSATTWGSAALIGNRAAVDAPVVARLREAGAIPLARTNLPDFAFRWHTESSRAGHTVNPWDPTRSPGGSSGGEAVALTAGMTPLGLGNDLGGSLRLPSQACGTLALRPTAGRVADAAVTEPALAPMSIQQFNCQGPMARRVADLRAALSILVAPDHRDARHVPLPFPAPASASGAGGAAHPLRVAVVRDPLGVGVDPQVAAGVERAARLLAEAGYDVVEAAPPLVAEAVATWVTLISADMAVLWPTMAPAAGPSLHRFIETAISRGVMRGDVPPAEVTTAWITRQAIANAWAAFALDHPVILGPVATVRPWAIDWDLEHPEDAAPAMGLVLPVNLLGLPSCAVPVGVGDGLPQGVQLIGPRFREDLILDAAEAIEERAGVAFPHLG